MSYALVVRGHHLHLGVNPSLPPIACRQPASLSCFHRCAHSLMNNLLFVRIPDLKNKRFALYAGDLWRQLGIRADHARQIFAKPNGVKMIAEIAESILQGVCPPPDQAGLKSAFQESFTRVLALVVPCFATLERLPLYESWYVAQWDERRLVVKVSDRLHDFVIGEFFAEGSTCKLYRLEDKLAPMPVRRWMLKVARSQEWNEVRHCERYITALVNPKGDVFGLPSPAYASVTLRQCKGSAFYEADIVEAYTGDAENTMVEQWADQRRILQQVLNGLEYLHRSEVFHGDIKPENIFLVPERGIADLGDLSGVCNRSSIHACLLRFQARQLSQEDLYIQLWGTHTPKYIHNHDRLAFAKLMQSYLHNQITLETTIEQLMLLMKLRDVYALAKSFYEIVTQDYELPSNPTEEHWVALRRQLLRAGASEDELCYLSDSLRLCMAEEFLAENRIYPRLVGLERLQQRFLLA